MYSKEIERVLKKLKIRVGDRVEVKKGKEKYEGILMPRIELGDKNCLVLKLENGYNLGIRFEKGVKIKLLKRGKPVRFRPSKARMKIDPSKPTVSILGCGGTIAARVEYLTCLLYTSPSPRDRTRSRMPSSA